METSTTTEILKLDDNRLQIIKTTTTVVKEDYPYDDIYDKIKSLEAKREQQNADIDNQIAEIKTQLAKAEEVGVVPIDPEKKVK